MTGKNSKRWLSLLMVICMIFTLLPGNIRPALADEGEAKEFTVEGEKQETEDNTSEYGDEGRIAKAASGAAIGLTASESVQEYNVWVGGIQVTDENKGGY